MGRKWGKKSFLLLVFFLFAALPGISIALVEADPVFYRLDVESGLPTNQVEDIVQDAYGYIWFATGNGLVRHDGHELRVLRHDPLNPESLPANNIQAIHAAKNGSVWIFISGQGLFELHGLEIVREWFTTAHGGTLQDDNVWAIQEDCDNNIWLMFSSGGLAKVHHDSGLIEHYAEGEFGILDAPLQIDFMIDSSCRLWLINSNEILLSAESSQPNFYPYISLDEIPLSMGISLYETAEHEFFVVGMTGIFEFDAPREGQSAMLLDDIDAKWTATDSVAIGLTSLDSENLWVSLNAGFVLFNKSSRQIKYHGYNRKLSSGELLLQTHSLLRDNEGSLWAGSYTRNILRLPPNWRAFRKLLFSEDTVTTPDSRIHPVVSLEGSSTVAYVNDEGSVFLSDLSKYPDQNEIKKTEIAFISDSPILTNLFIDSEWVWAQSHNDFIRVHRETGERENLLTHGYVENIRFVTPDGRGNFWLSDRTNDIKLIDAQGRTLRRWHSEGVGLEQLNLQDALAIQQGPDKNWWLLSRHALHRLSDEGGFERIFYRSDLPQSALAFDEDSIWLAGESFLEQLVWRDGQLESVRQYFASDGLPVARIIRIFPRSDQVLLLLEAGLAQLDLATGKFREFSAKEGLPSSHFTGSAALELTDGRIVAGVADGLLLIDPDEISVSSLPPPTYITAVRAGEELITVNQTVDDRISLDWRQNSLEFSFTGLSYLNPQRNEFRMRLIGWDDDWQSQIGQTSRYYSNLPSGTYRFELQAANVDGIWNLEGDQLEIVIARPPWRSAWAMAGYFLLALTGGTLSWRTFRSNRQRRYEMRRAQEQRALARSQRDFLQLLNQSLEPEYLAKTIGLSVLKLLERPIGWVAYLNDDMPQDVFALSVEQAEQSIDRDLFDQQLQRADTSDVVLLQSDHQPLAAMWIPDLQSRLNDQLQSELDLLVQAAAQVIQNARLLISVRRYAEQADRANRAKSNFLATMSHEIRTPLHGLLGMIDLLKSERLSPQHIDMLRTMRTSGDQLQRILNDILDLSRIEADRIELHEEPFELVELLEQAVELHAANASVNGLDLRLQMASDLPIIALGDADRIAQVLGNLLSNAIKFTDRGAIEVQSWLGADGYLNIAVSDTGPGIEAKSQSTLFQPFTQLESSTTRRHSGTGLGLAICRRIIDEMGGSIDLHSRVGQGSRFTLRLPLEGMQKQAPRSLRLLDDYRLGVAVSAPYARILLRMCRRWNLKLVQTKLDFERLDGLVIQRGFVDETLLRNVLDSGLPIWQLSNSTSDDSPLADGVQSLRLPLITSRLIAALIDRLIRVSS
ncbi:MAG: ATP-binding protein [Pseudomonadota bacterium]